LTHQSIYNPN